MKPIIVCVAFLAAITAPASACDDRFQKKCEREIAAPAHAGVTPAQAQPQPQQQQRTASPNSVEPDITMRDVLRVIGNGLAGFADGYNAARPQQQPVVIMPPSPPQSGILPSKSFNCTSQRGMGGSVDTYCR